MCYYTKVMRARQGRPYFDRMRVLSLSITKYTLLFLVDGHTEINRNVCVLRKERTMKGALFSRHKTLITTKYYLKN